MSSQQVRHRRSGESGQATAYFVATAILLFALMALAFDVGFLFHARRVAQNAADPAALAGAAYLDGCALGDEEGTPQAVASDYAGRNLVGKTFPGPLGDDTNASLGEFQYTDEHGERIFNTVKVRVDRDQRYIFANFLGLSSVIVPAEAQAACVNAEDLGICPFYIEAAEGQIHDVENNFGLQINHIYKFKSGPDGDDANHGQLSIFGDGVVWPYVAAGCVGDNPDYTVESGVTLTDTKPGVETSVFQNGLGELYDYEGKTISGTTYPDTEDCDIEFDPDPFDAGQTWVNSGLDDDDIDELVELCNDDPNPDDNVSGRVWTIGIVDLSDCGGGRCFDVEISHVAQMYIACAPYANSPAANRCDPGDRGDRAIYGMFMEARPVNIQVKGISTNPLAPMHVILVK